MSDQADHLRQLVEAHRVWHELTQEEHSTARAKARSRPAWSALSGRVRKSGRPARDPHFGFWAARAARWALSHVGR